MKTPKISEAEWEVMKVLWERSPRTANQIVNALRAHKWTAATIRTLIGRLVGKGALRYEKLGREHVYSPAVTRDSIVQQERHSFIRRVYDGAVQPMVAALLEEEDLSPEDLEALHRLLDEKRKGPRR
jgi:BlaI family penicillinase repressor